MAELKLHAELREKTGNRAEALRREGKVPAVVYGPEIENMNLTLDEVEVKKVYEQGGESTLVDLMLPDREPIKVIFQDVQRHPLKHQVNHLDLRQIKMGEAITASVSVEIVGEAPAVKNQGAVLMQNQDTVEIHCLPSDLISQIEVDVSNLEEIGDAINAGDLKVPKGIEIVTDPELAVVTTQAPRSVAEEEAEEEAEAGEAGVEAEAGEGAETEQAE